MAKKNSVRYFRVISTGKVVYGGKTYTKGECVPVSDPDVDLRRMFKNKFKLVANPGIVDDDDDEPEAVEEVVKKVPAKAEPKSALKEEKEDDEGDDNELGEDVTHKFPLAKTKGYNVFKGLEGYFVTEEGETEVLNKNGAAVVRENVDRIIRRHVEEEEDRAESEDEEEQPKTSKKKKKKNKKSNK